MSELKYRLLSGDDPQGRQKIYFCCHPEDFEVTFDLLCEDIFSRAENCAIYYEADPHGSFDREELLFQLGEMQLIVVPVTRRLLDEPSRAMELELPFAFGALTASDGKTRHIPVLPVLFGDDLKADFRATALFKDVQYLNRFAEDKTALSYDEKLRRFLISVIVSGAEAARIRSEFRAGIFLSYRKKDREAARGLMERIHWDELCRDVSIWYDEYLVPGESWRKTIEEALASCDLFVLSVTPMLLAEGNFVWREEYPRAHDQLKKPILSVITAPEGMSDEEMQTLRAMYDRIDESLTDGPGQDALADGLHRSLIDKAGKKDLLTPDDGGEHLYYIALAYKNSVGVEMDPKKAVSLLEKSGENGYRHAYLTLGNVFEFGEGVPRDEDRAISYYDRFIGLQKPEFGTSRQGDMDLVLAYDAKGMILIGRSRLQEALDVYMELHTLLDAMTSCFGSFKQINLPISLERLGRIRYALGDYDAARKYFEKALQVRLDPPKTENIATEEERTREEAENKNRWEAKMGLAVSYYDMGEILLAGKDLTGAAKYLLKSRELFSELDAEKEDHDLKICLSKSYTRIAEVYEAEGKHKQAKEICEKALAILEPLLKNQYDFEAGTLRAANHIALSDITRNSGQINQAHRLICEALDEVEALIGKAPSRKTRTLLATAYERRGTLEEQLGNIEPAKQYYKMNIDISKELVEGSEDPEEKRGFAIACEKLALFLVREPMRMSTDDVSSACGLLEKDLEITESLTKGKTDYQHRRDMAVCYDALCEVYQYQNKEKALEYGVKGLVIAYHLAEDPGTPQELFDLANFYYSIGKLCGDIKNVCFQNAHVLWSKVYQASPSEDLGKKIQLLEEMMKRPATECAIEPGYCSGIKELTDKWSEETSKDVDYADISPIERKASAGGMGCLPLLLAVAVLVCLILQLFGVVDFAGKLKSVLGDSGAKVVVGVVWVVSLIMLVCSAKFRKR